MNVSSRTAQILELLLRSDRDLTAAEIADSIHVSSRTVHRELGAVEQVLTGLNIELVKKSGSGIRIQGDEKRLEILRGMVATSEDIEFTPDERQIYLLAILLQSQEPKKLFTLAHELKVTVATISNDLDEMLSWIEKFRLTLIRRRGYGVEITGEEAQLREAIRQLIKLRLDDAELIDSNQRELHLIDRELFSLAGKRDMADAESVLWSWEEHWTGRLGEQAYTDLLIRISITLQRIQAGKFVQIAAVSEYECEEKLEAARLARLLAEKLNVPFNDAETVYLSKLMNTAKAVDISMLPGDDLALAEIVRLLILELEQLTALNFSEDRSLRDGLFSHMKASLQRLDEGLRIRNPLLEQIKKDYIFLYENVQSACARVLPEVKVPDEEIGFLVMHFGASLERLKQLHRDVSVILVCTSGIGSSKLLQIRLQKELPQIEIVDRVSWYEATRFADKSFDFVISTVDLPLDHHHYIKVSPLLTPDDVERLRAFVRGMPLHRKHARARSERQSSVQIQPDFEHLMSLKKTLDEIVQITDSFKVTKIGGDSRSLSAILEEACRMEEQDEVLKGAAETAQLLIEREHSGSQMIPGTNLALFHTRSPAITRSSLSLYCLEEPFMIDSTSRTELKLFLLMLAPRNLSKESLEVLSEISAMLLDSQMVELLEASDESVIRHYLTVNLKNFFRTKIESE